MVFNFLKSSYQKVKNALVKSSQKLTGKIRDLFSSKIDEETLEKLEELLYEADLGVQMAQELTEHIQSLYRRNSSLTADELIEALKNELLIRGTSIPTPELPAKSPLVILIVGVNGNGKTTTVAKLAKNFQNEGKKVLVAAGDTFRAAGIEQLEMWAQRLGIEIVKGATSSDPAAVAFDAASAAKARGSDILLIDTAGRLHTKTHLMQELEKVRRVLGKVIPESPHETWLVLDATTGQNALDQAKVFHQFTPLTSLILTKLDGSAKGGIVFRILSELKIPIRYIGVGEGADDLLSFNAEEFTTALFE